MVNWVTRGDVPNAAKGGLGFFAVAVLVVTGLVLGAWWWITGGPLFGEPAVGWRRALTVAGRLILFGGFFALASVDGAVGWLGAAGVFALAVLGFATANREVEQP